MENMLKMKIVYNVREMRNERTKQVKEKEEITLFFSWTKCVKHNAL